MLIEGTQKTIVTHVKIEKLISPSALFDEARISEWRHDPRTKVFFLGVPCEAGHKNAFEGRLGVQQGPKSLREVLGELGGILLHP